MASTEPNRGTAMRSCPQRRPPTYTSPGRETWLENKDTPTNLAAKRARSDTQTSGGDDTVEDTVEGAGAGADAVEEAELEDVEMAAEEDMDVAAAAKALAALEVTADGSDEANDAASDARVREGAGPC